VKILITEMRRKDKERKFTLRFYGREDAERGISEEKSH
jgi:hypothetical protein